MKLLLVVPTLSSYDAFLSDFAKAAVAEGHDVHVATHLNLLDGRVVEADDLDCQQQGVYLHSVSMPRGASPIGALKAARQLRKLVGKIEPDWIQAHFSAAAFVCAIGKEQYWPYTSCIIQGLACTLAKARARLVAWFGERFAIARLDEMWVLTKDDFAVIKRWNRMKARLQASPGFGCRIDQFDPVRFSTEWRRARRAELGICERSTVLIFVGRLTAFKGFDRVVKVYRALKENGTPVSLLVVGIYDSLHPSGLTEVEIQSLDEDPDVIMAGWQQNVAEWLAISDLSIFPSEREGMPVGLMEAICMGVPVVTSCARGCRDVVRDGVDGVVVSESKTASWVAVVDSLIHDPEKLRLMKSAALARREHFDRRRFVEDQLLEIRKLSQ